MTDDFVLNELKDLRRQVEELITDDKGEAAVIDAVLRFPGLVGFWPMSSTNGSGDAVDVSGNANHLTNTSDSLFSSLNDVVGYVDYDGTADYHSHADATDFDIIGDEAFIATNGLTMGGWFWYDTLTAATQYASMAKWAVSIASASYMIDYFDAPRFLVSDGVGSKSVSGAALSTGTWYFLAARFVPSTSIDIYVNGTKTSNTTTIYATLNNSTTIFTISSKAGAGQYIDGRASNVFLCNSALTDAQLNDYFELSRPLFGV